MASPFSIQRAFEPAGDQPKAIESLIKGISRNLRHQTLLGVTGSGKTFTMANVIQAVGKPTLVLAHNKTLAAQLAQEYREFFPNNAVHYFVSYYDYYQPEAYMPVSDTYIEKEAMINAEIERLRHASTQALLTRKDVIVVASVSCIYGLGSPIEYEKVNLRIDIGMKITRSDLIRRLVDIHFSRTTADLEPGLFRVVGNNVEVMPVNEKNIYRLSLGPDSVVAIETIDHITRRILEQKQTFFLFPAKHFITSKEEANRAFVSIKKELELRLRELISQGKNLEAERLKRRTQYDLALIREVGYCNGIENYSRHFSGKKAGEAPDTLLSYFPHKADGTADFLTIVDESHVSIPQIGGMYAGDQSRKKTLIEHGFRLPSAADNRPLTFSEFESRVGQTVYTSATPGAYEKEKSTQVVEQVIRPTGLLDPIAFVRPVVERDEYKGQIADFVVEAQKVIKKGFRAIGTTLTKKMAEDLVEHLKEKNIKCAYLHSDIKTIERIEILTEFRRGTFDILIGVNLLREGLDLPEVSFIGIFDADKEGFLRSETSLIQIIGRAARNSEGTVVLYADTVTGSIERALKETNRRRALQIEYNKKHGITPKTIIKAIKDITDHIMSEHKKAVGVLLELDEEFFKKNPKLLLKEKERNMNDAVKILDFETAALIRDEIQKLEERLITAEKKQKKEDTKQGKNRLSKDKKKRG